MFLLMVVSRKGLTHIRVSERVAEFSLLVVNVVYLILIAAAAAAAAAAPPPWARPFSLSCSSVVRLYVLYANLVALR